MDDTVLNTFIQGATLATLFWAEVYKPEKSEKTTRKNYFEKTESKNKRKTWLHIDNK